MAPRVSSVMLHVLLCHQCPVQECEGLRRSCEALMVEKEELVSKHSHLLARHAIACAVHRLEGERIHILEERCVSLELYVRGLMIILFYDNSAHCREAEIRKLKKKLSKCASLVEVSPLFCVTTL